MIKQIEEKVVNRLRQVTSAIKQDGANQVSIITSTAERQAAIEFAKAAAMRPSIVGAALKEIARDPAVSAGGVRHPGGAKHHRRGRPHHAGAGKFRPAGAVAGRRAAAPARPAGHGRRAVLRSEWPRGDFGKRWLTGVPNPIVAPERENGSQIRLGVMIKVLASWFLIGIGALLSAGALIMLSIYVYRELSWHLGPHTISITDSRKSVPDFIGTQILGIPYTIWTTAWATVIGQLGLGLVVVAVGLHIRHLHRQDVGRERLEQRQIQMHNHGSKS